MKNTLLILAGVALAASASAFSSGNLVIAVQKTDGVTTKTSKPMVIREFTTAGVQVGSEIALPYQTTDNPKFVSILAEQSEGQINRTEDGRFLTMGGFDGDIDQTDAGAIINRAILRMNPDGSYKIVGGIAPEQVGGDSTRQAYSLDGNGFWVTGGNAGIDYFTFGSKISSPVVDDSVSSRSIFSYNGNLYFTSSDDTLYNGTGYGNTLYSLSGQPTSGNLTPNVFFAFNPSPRTFVFTSPTTCYVGSTTSGSPGIRKWEFNGSIWVNTGNSGTPIVAQFVDAGPYNGTGRRFYAIRGNGTELKEILDNGDGTWSQTTLHTFPTNDYASGISFAPTATKSITFNVDLEDYTKDDSQVLTCQIRTTAGALVEETLVFSYGNGIVTFPTNVANGSYNLYVKGSTWLSKLPSITVTNSGASAGTLSLLNGDCDGSDYINTDDYLVLSGSFDLGLGDAGFEVLADLDGNDYVNTDDYLILSKNFDQGGEGL